jgi:GPI ethanolamine phosphate transferase 3 subunit O
MKIIRIFLLLLSLYFYLDGFFLTKREILDINSFNSSQLQASPKFQNVFIFLIDALRYDFVLSKNDSNFPSPFSTIHEIRQTNSSQCFFAGFRGDPPTTTSQRLRGIMTGSLPTFIEIGSNFQSSAVLEDSLIKQWNLSGKQLTMLGDDTWISLFPDQFHLAHPFDSFNTRDINTVDEGILKYLWDFLHGDHVTRQWDILIAHFLGVDHIGHTYHAHHPLMKQRLHLMNEVLKKVIEDLPEDALLVLMGDHGMTLDGEHGTSQLLVATLISHLIRRQFRR